MKSSPSGNPTSSDDDQPIDEQLDSTPGVLSSVRGPAGNAAAAALLMATFAACAPGEKAADPARVESRSQLDAGQEEREAYLQGIRDSRIKEDKVDSVHQRNVLIGIYTAMDANDTRMVDALLGELGPVSREDAKERVTRAYLDAHRYEEAKAYADTLEDAGRRDALVGVVEQEFAAVAVDPSKPLLGSPASDVPKDRYDWAVSQYGKDDIWNSGYVSTVWSGIDLADNQGDEASVNVGLGYLGDATHDTALQQLSMKYARNGDGRALRWIERMKDPSRRGIARDQVTKAMLARSEGGR